MLQNRSLREEKMDTDDSGERREIEYLQQWEDYLNCDKLLR